MDEKVEEVEVLRPEVQGKQSSTRHAKGIFTMDEIRAATILDQHLASTTPEARTRRPKLAHTWPLHPLSLDTRNLLGTQDKKQHNHLQSHTHRTLGQPQPYKPRRPLRMGPPTQRTPS
jgi:hypothetical protein